MSAKVTLEEAQAHLPELIASLIPGEEVLITQNEQPVARLIGQPGGTAKRPVGAFPVISIGLWPEGLSLRREDIYGDDGR
jgi:hypothetical protein